MATLRIQDTGLAFTLIRDRQLRGIDEYDEVWEGVYIVPPMANLEHQDLAGDLNDIFHRVIRSENRGRVQAGANVSDRRSDWETSFRVPDMVVVLHGGQAVDCGTHWFGGPDFLVEVQSPGDDTDMKIPFYGLIKVQELLIIQRDNRLLRLFRHDGQQLVQVEPSDWRGQKWLRSEVVPLAFRRKGGKGTAATEVRRTDGKRGSWTV
jgi:Uma2 family endonuclease